MREIGIRCMAKVATAVAYVCKGDDRQYKRISHQANPTAYSMRSSNVAMNDVASGVSEGERERERVDRHG